MSSTLRTTLIGALVGAVSVSAHGHISQVTVNGKSFKGFDPTAAPFGPQPDSVTWSNGAKDNGFVLSSAVNDPDIICHLDAKNAALSVPVNAGDEVELTWNQWPESHSGPVIDYLADCGGDCSTVDKTSLKFFKIAEAGQTSLGAGGGQRGKWADDELLANNLKWTVKVPTSIKAGNYVLRHELIALHEAGTEGKAQLYPQCINLKVTSSGTESPAGVAGTALYTSKDEGIKYNIYNDETKPKYKIPGPALFAAGSSNAGNGGNKNQGGNNNNQGSNNNNQGNNNQGSNSQGNNNQGNNNQGNNNQGNNNQSNGCNSKRRRHARHVKI